MDVYVPSDVDPLDRDVAKVEITDVHIAIDDRTAGNTAKMGKSGDDRTTASNCSRGGRRARV